MKNTLHWYFEISKVFFKKSLLQIIAAAIFTLASQAFRIFSYFLPLKIIILVSSGSTPGYFPSFLEGIGLNKLIVTLSLATAGAYFMHLVLEKAADKAVAKGSTTVLEKNNKIAIFEKQQEIAKASYQRYVKSLANIFFIALALSLLFVIYRDLALFISLSALTIVISEKIIKKIFGKEKSISRKITENINAASGTFFLISFSFIIVDYIYFTPPGFLPIIVGLLMCRQISNKLTAVNNELKRINSQREKITTLFLRKNFMPAKINNSLGIWDEIYREEWQKKIIDNISKTIEIDLEKYHFEWSDYLAPGIFYFKIETYKDSFEFKSFYLKIFDKGVILRSIHEITLLLDENKKSLPCPTLIANYDEQDRRYHIFEISEHTKFNGNKIDENTFTDAYIEACKFKPSEDLIASYKKSRSFFWEKWSNSYFKKLQVVAKFSSSENDTNNLKQLMRRLPEIKSFLKNRPLVVVNHEIRPNSVWHKNASTSKGASCLILSDWSKWSIEPMGVGFPINEKYLCVLHDQLQNHPEDMAVFSNYELIKLTAYLYDLDVKYSKNKFSEALNMLPETLELFNKAIPNEQNNNLWNF